MDENPTEGNILSGHISTTPLPMYDFITLFNKLVCFLITIYFNFKIRFKMFSSIMLHICDVIRAIEKNIIKITFYLSKTLKSV